jgi:hypothetical protein
LGDRVVVLSGRSRATRNEPNEPAVVLTKVPNKAAYNVKLANDEVETVARKFIMRREDYDRVAEVFERPVT